MSDDLFGEATEVDLIDEFDEVDEPGSTNLLPLAVGAVALLGILGLLGYFLLAGSSDSPDLASAPANQTEDAGPATTVPAEVLNETTEPVATTLAPLIEPLGARCVIDLEQMPHGPMFELVEDAGGDECKQKLRIQNQYGDQQDGNGVYDGPLGPWNESVEECWAGDVGQLVWVRFQLPAAQEFGWLALGQNRTFSDERNSASFSYDLLTSPQLDADSVGTYTHAELATRANQLVIVVPESLDTDPIPNGESSWHLAGCWQESPYNPSRGLHFYWT